MRRNNDYQVNVHAMADAIATKTIKEWNAAQRADGVDFADFTRYLEGYGKFEEQFRKFIPAKVGSPDKPFDSEIWPDDYSHVKEGKPEIAWIQRVAWALGGRG